MLRSRPIPEYNFNGLRIFSGITLLLFAWAGPFWIFIPLLFVLIIIFPKYYEGIAIVFMFEVLFLPKNGTISFLLLITLCYFILVESLRGRVRLIPHN
jgi:hypothetical protein